MSTDTTPVGFNALRNAALHRARELGLPTTRLESWRYVNLKGFQEEIPIVDREDGETMAVPVGRSSEPGVVFTNGVLDPDGSPALPEGVDLHTYAGDVMGSPILGEWQEALSSYGDAAACWTIADMRSAAHLDVSAHLDKPLILLNLATEGASAWRLRVDLAPGSRCKILVLHLVAEGARSSIGIEVNAGPGATFEGAEIDFGQDENHVSGELLSHCWAKCQEESSVIWGSSGCGGKLVRHNWEAELLGPKAHAAFTAATSVDGTNQSHHRISVNHAAPDTTSRQFVRNVADGQARISFDGVVKVQKGCDGADAQQVCKNLQLSDAARIGGRPQLEIHTDEVVASHGMSTGRPDEEALWYLRSRGLSKDLANSLLLRGFLEEAVAQLPVPRARNLARRRLDLPEVENA